MLFCMSRSMFSRLRLLSLTLFLIPIAPVIAATLSGTVRDSNGDPIQGANVWVNQNRDIKQAVTDAEGAFAIPDLLVTMTEVVVYKENFALGGSAAPMAGDEALDVVLRPADLISIRVIDTDSRPIAGVKVRSMLIEQRTLVSVEDLEPFGYPALRSTDNVFLVERDGRVVGAVTVESASETPYNRRDAVPVFEVMTPIAELPRLAGDTPIGQAAEMLRLLGDRPALVEMDGQPPRPIRLTDVLRWIDRFEVLGG